MKLKQPSTRMNYDIHTLVDVRMVAELVQALSEKDCYQPTNNSSVARCAIEVFHELFVPDEKKGTMSTEEALSFLTNRGFSVPSVNTVDGMKRLRKLVKDAARENTEVEEVSQSQTAREVAAAFEEAAKEGGGGGGETDDF